jgi:hypothetical protein
MAKFTDYFKIVVPKPGVTTMTDNQNIGDQGTYANYTWYQRLIQGSASRITRYREYDLMDNDVEVARSLDTIAEEMIGADPNDDMPLELIIEGEKEEKIPSSSMITLRTALRYWSDIHEWNTRLFKVARVTAKYGDCFFHRKSETGKWEYVHPKNVIAAIVDERNMTKVLGWQMRKETKTPNSPYNQPTGQYGTYSQEMVDTYPSEDVVWFSLNDDIAESAPFGESILRAVYRAQKQKELLEDAVIIYRIQRAPERRVFYIDVGKMPPQRVKAYLEQIKNEIRQKKIPTFGGGVDQVDSVYNPQQMCLALDTKIPLLDGRIVTLQTMIDEHIKGVQNWVYSVNPKTGQLVPGIVSWAGITQHNAQTIQLTLDNGQQVICTPEHKFPVQGKGFVEAKDLTTEDSLFPFNAREHGLSNNKSRMYQQIYDTSCGDWTFTHRMVAEFMPSEEHVFNVRYIDAPKQVIHHRDFNKYNNNPDNLVYMNSKDHTLLHSHEFTSNVNIIKGRQQHWIRLATDSAYRMQQGTNRGATLSATINNSQSMKEKFVANLRSCAPKIGNQSLQFTHKMFQIVVDIILDNPTITLNKLIELININSTFMNEYTLANRKTYLTTNNVVWLNKIKTTALSKRSLGKMLKYFGYTNFKTLRTKLATQHVAYANHRVIKIEPGVSQDVGTLTIDQNHQYHNYHTFALDCGVFTKNSEDFFFAQRPEGRGSKVESLPGGQGLGELADLEYFQWKVFRGLRIPLSFMREGNDNAILNDGKIGVAYVQELRFANYIKRLQGYIAKVLDKEFKRYLRMARINVDPTIFRIALPEPENFGIWRQQQLDSELLSTMSTAIGVQSISPRFAFKRFGQLTEKEVLENERLRAEEMGLDPDNLSPEDMMKIYVTQPEGGMGMEPGGGMTAGTFGPGLGMGDDMGADMGADMGGDMGAETAAPGEVGAETGMPAGSKPADLTGNVPVK